jgi:hypothetical protein
MSDLRRKVATLEHAKFRAIGEHIWQRPVCLEAFSTKAGPIVKNLPNASKALKSSTSASFDSDCGGTISAPGTVASRTSMLTWKNTGSRTHVVRRSK